MFVATEQETKKHFVELWARETIIRRVGVIVEAPASWDAEQVKSLNGGEVAMLSRQGGCNLHWEIEESESWEILNEISVLGEAPSGSSPDVIISIERGVDPAESTHPELLG